MCLRNGQMVGPQKKISMKTKPIIALISLFILTVSCSNEVKNLSDLQSNFYELQHNGLRLGDSLNVYFFKNQELVDSVELTWNGKSVSNHTVLDTANTNLGVNELKIKVHLGSEFITGETHVPILNSTKETSISYDVINEYPHPKELFTQGFFYHDDKIYESSGHYGKSKIVTYHLGTTNFLQETKQEAKVFSEGISILNGKLFLLTYKERKALVYDAQTFELKEEIALPNMVKEGWGMTTNGKELIVSDGTQNVFFFNEKFELQRKIQIAGYQSVYTYINELEFVNGKLFANVWTTNFILVIDPKTGAVEQFYDLTDLSESKGSDDVLNGIAVKGNQLLVTGKNWEKIYELPLPN